ncbi:MULTISPECIES: hypothetical protein [Arthrobacter]|uniref:hypothetical protein n=1 Tax=Arthrobacter TaxID=1663 RepID=UPI0006DAB4DB|nr:MULTISPECIES: hypothetical protein [unclassified Arthrobacter]KPN18830.1 hypothetical protein AO716_13805 [Arthrobacter sp. Edens01]MSS00471.1 hypothetical protein [Arthrobacter sp. BL-252-APC-1A]
MAKPSKKPQTPNQVIPDPDLQVNIAPAAARRLSEEGMRRLAAAQQQEAGLPGWQSLGKGGKPNHANGRQGPRERKVRW